MRKAFVLTVLLLLPCWQPFHIAQDSEPSAGDLLEQYIAESDAEKRSALRDKLVVLGPMAVAEAIQVRDFKTPDQLGETKYLTTCPDGYERPYWVWLSGDYDPRTPAALLVCLHGGVMRAPVDSGLGVSRWWANYAAARENARPLVVLTASADCYETTMNAAWWRDGGRANVHHFIRETRMKFNIDDDRVFITGFSDGGSGTFSMAFRSPEAFAGYFPMMGDPLIPTTDQVQHCYTNLVGANIYALNGGKDGIYPGAEMEKLYKAANKRGASIDYTIYPDVGHEWADQDTEFPKILGLMETWKREPLPEKIDWTTDQANLGRRSWLSIDATGELNKRDNKADEPDPDGGGAFRLDLGVKVPHDYPPFAKAEVGRVEPGLTASRMGIEAGDVIVKIDDQDVTMFSDIRMHLMTKQPGEDVSLTIERNGERRTFNDKLNERRKTHSGRIQAKRKPGKVELEIYDVTRFSIWVSAEMLNDNGEIQIKLNKTKIFDGKVEPDASLMLDEFDRTGERSCRFVARLQFNVAEALEKK